MEITHDGKNHPEMSHVSGYEEEIAYFVRCIENDEKPAMVTPESSALSIRIVEAEKESIETGLVVEV
jgi:predicted dehydrogenase